MKPIDSVGSIHSGGLLTITTAFEELERTYRQRNSGGCRMMAIHTGMKSREERILCVRYCYGNTLSAKAIKHVWFIAM
jgi:hypothetical protein